MSRGLLTGARLAGCAALAICLGAYALDTANPVAILTFLGILASLFTPGSGDPPSFGTVDALAVYTADGQLLVGPAHNRLQVLANMVAAVEREAIESHAAHVEV